MRILAKSASALIIGVALAVTSLGEAGARPNCQDILNNNTYRCEGKTSSGAEGTLCLRFVSPGVFSSNFDLDFGEVKLGCSCKPQGSFKRPKFNESRSWYCVGTGEEAFLFEGFASPFALHRVRGADSRGSTAIYNCKRDPDCANDLSAATSGASSFWTQ